MVTRITDEQKIEINKLYKIIGTYSGVAKEMGISPSTVKRYIIPAFNMPDETATKNITIDVEPTPVEEICPFTTEEAIYNSTKITQEEIDELKKLWKEIVM